MNNRCYRLVFSKLRGMLTAVAETMKISKRLSLLPLIASASLAGQYPHINRTMRDHTYGDRRRRTSRARSSRARRLA
ncbi:ESPR-type extended signal peptide-containing protein [Paraburkholderia sp. EG304]|uniref:ESPR-type extended signal peptide-containing protein n=1 Tax=Paraburkholderia sp. EG304 TaxID=3237015 RepID=UPI00397E33E9